MKKYWKNRWWKPEKTFKIIKSTYSLPFFIAGISIIFLLAECKKEEFSELGKDLLPGADKKNFLTDTSTNLSAYTITEDSIATSGVSLFLLGEYTDPVFGKVSADFITEVELGKILPDGFDSSAVADSVFLYLEYSDFYGDASSTFLIDIYELNDTINASETHYSDFDPAGMYNPTPLQQTAFSPASMKTSTLKINLPTSFGNSILSGDSSYFESNEAFRGLFKGFYISASLSSTGSIPLNVPVYYQSNGCIAYFDVYSENTKLKIYYNYHDSVEVKDTNGNPIKKDTILYDDFTFDINSSCPRVNMYHTDYSSTSFNAQINDTTTQYDKIYLHALGGLKNKIKIDNNFYEKWQDSGLVAVQKAELFIKIDDDSDLEEFLPAVNLGLRMMDENGDEYYLPDDPGNMGLSYFDGVYGTTGSRTYRFNISRYIQELINGTTSENDLVVFIGRQFQINNTTTTYSYNIRSAERTVLGTSSIRLIIIYSKL